MVMLNMFPVNIEMPLIEVNCSTIDNELLASLLLASILVLLVVVCMEWVSVLSDGYRLYSGPLET